MDYENALEYLAKVERKGSCFQLHTVEKVIAELPFSLSNITFVQVAGTNGKGSTAHFLASVLQAANYKVGLFTSPQIEDIRDTVTINKEWIATQDFANSITQVKEIAQKLLDMNSIERMPTYFEYLFLAALHHFDRCRVHIAVLEVGLGGRDDATTAITPAVSVITGVSQDHTGILGKRIRDIAGIKAGIIKREVPVVCGCSVYSAANTVIKKRAAQYRAPFHNVIDAKNRLTVEPRDNFRHCVYHTPTGSYRFDVFLNGSHQTRNAAAAVKILQLLHGMGFHISEGDIYNGIKANRIPARIETLATNPPVILDGAHNLQSAGILKEFLEQEGKRRLTLIFGVLGDKNYRPMVRLLLPFIDRVILTEPNSKRALPAGKLSNLFRAAGKKTVLVRKDFHDALETAGKWRNEILVTGSFYLAGEIRKIIVHGE